MTCMATCLNGARTGIATNEIGGTEHAAIWYLRRSVRNVADAMHWLRLIANLTSGEDCYSYDEKRELERLLPGWNWSDCDRTEELLVHICETIHLYVDLDCRDEHAVQIKAFAGGQCIVRSQYSPPRKIMYQAVGTRGGALSTVPIHELN